MRTSPARPDPADLLVRQLRAIDAWQRLHHSDQRALAANPDTTREHRMELRRRMDALHTEAHALREHCLHGTHQPHPPRAVLIHRQPWLLDRLTAGLTDLGVQVVASTSDGARGCGIAIAEAPELVFLEAALPSMTGLDVTRRVLQCSPTTLVTAQIPQAEQRPALLAAGATAVWPRQRPPVDLLHDLAGLLSPPHARSRSQTEQAP